MPHLHEQELAPAPTIPDVKERLGSMGINVASFLSPEQLAQEKEAKKTEAEQKAIDDWKSAVESVEADTAQLRQQQEALMKEAADYGLIKTLEEAEKRLALIDATVARGPVRHRTYNGHPGDKWHRSQAYHVTVDEEGNIWGDFQPGRNEIGITGKPVSPGKHIIHKNPTLPKETPKK